MAPCNSRVFLSKLLKFTVGADCETVVIHSDILKSYSTPWFNADSGSFAGGDSIVINDADQHIFSLVCQYLYTGDYYIKLPSDTLPPDLTSGGQEKSEQNHVIILEGNLFRDTESVDKFTDYLVRRIHPRPSQGLQGSYNRMEDYTETLLTHARLYVFAAKYELQELRDICLFKLLYLLHVFPIYEDRVGDIVRLFYFTFNVDTGRCENLRGMLRYYAAQYIRLFVLNRDFQILLQDKPALANLLLNTLGGGL